MADLVHLRLVTPETLREAVTGYVASTGAAVNLVVMPAAASQPAGDVITFDVVREAINDVLGELQALGVADQGSISVFRTDLSLSTPGDRVHELAPGDPDDTIIWEAVAARLRQSVAPSLPYLAFFVVASIIGATGVLTDSPVLIVGAMVVGPEYGALAATAFGLQRRDSAMVWQGVSTFLVGAACGIAAATLTTLLVRWADAVPAPYLSGDRPLTEFITSPDLFTVLVASAAGVAGMLALTQDRAGTLIGVLISVTTLPAISEVGVGIAFGNGDEVTGAATQLAVNLACLIAVGVLTLTVLRRLTPKLGPTRLRP